MKLGVCYMVFDGHELLEFAARSIRNEVDFISATYQHTSYFGNPADPDLVPNMERLKAMGLIDELIFFEPNLKVHHKENELALRNLGLEASRKQGCTHHISSDVDEFYLPAQLATAKRIMEEGGYDFSVVPLEMYYKEPTYLVTPCQNLQATLIHPVENHYEMVPHKIFPLRLEVTRRMAKYDNFRVFTKEECTQHHMSYVRKDIKRKLQNSDQGRFYPKREQFYENFDKYQVGGRVCIAPEFKNRRTIEVQNIFGIHF